jgi:hypothetical protein
VEVETSIEILKHKDPLKPKPRKPKTSPSLDMDTTLKNMKRKYDEMLGADFRTIEELKDKRFRVKTDSYKKTIEDPDNRKLIVFLRKNHSFLFFVRFNLHYTWSICFRIL